MSLFPEFDEQGMDDTETILRPLVNHVRPMLLNSWKERRKVAFTDNAQRMKRVLDNLQRKIDEVPVSIADLGGTEIDLRFSSSKEGRISVIVAPYKCTSFANR
ncbi:hypothetical protein RHGRI_023766 [Rhododendron griersonianum]|uniref:Uncharacterized protein n=1 Tax=Rhododendron griersonianum TaxID=479676 RepID=A0AAV6JA20_9ERIC|nr:hypothetical protein RHGRI_023766 [Rhododendron griersonianum]